MNPIVYGVPFGRRSPRKRGPYSTPINRKPLRAFDDGRKVYLQFPSGLRQGDAPPLFITGSNGEPALVNYRVRDNYYIVDRLFAAAELRFGSDPQQVVRITRTDATYRTVKASTKNLWGIRHDR